MRRSRMGSTTCQTNSRRRAQSHNRWRSANFATSSDTNGPMPAGSRSCLLSSYVVSLSPRAPTQLMCVCVCVHIQCSHEENFAWLNTPDDHQTAVKIANPKTLEFQVVRTSLLPGLLKTIRENRSHALPLRIFETSDVVFKDVTRERQTRNVRDAAAVWCNKTAGFEIVHGLLDRAMAMLEVPHIPGGEPSAAPTGYYIKERTGA